jgi:hypothetical protein
VTIEEDLRENYSGKVPFFYSSESFPGLYNRNPLTSGFNGVETCGIHLSLPVHMRHTLHFGLVM